MALGDPVYIGLEAVFKKSEGLYPKLSGGCLRGSGLRLSLFCFMTLLGRQEERGQ